MSFGQGTSVLEILGQMFAGLKSPGGLAGRVSPPTRLQINEASYRRGDGGSGDNGGLDFRWRGCVLDTCKLADDAHPTTMPTRRRCPPDDNAHTTTMPIRRRCPHDDDAHATTMPTRRQCPHDDDAHTTTMPTR
ncbi:hypothetical protein BDZ89DRAFT_1049038 [Hymenopellis radicata]|nr:hypothetical protein BDZ89DRAFT_1049038 [Hymenopellis radicata]